MPQKRKGLRLYLEHRAGRPAAWCIRDGAKKIRTGCGEVDFAQAEKALADYAASKFRPDTGQRDLAKITVAEVMAMYLQDFAIHHAAPALASYHSDRLLEFWGDKSLRDVRGSSCREYVAHRAAMLWNGKPISQSTARRELVTLQAAINRWDKESPLPHLPRVTLPKEGQRRERWLTRGEAASLLRAARRLGHAHVARFILIGLYTGTRHAAILGLRWSASATGGYVNLASGTILRKKSSETETKKRNPRVAIPKMLHRHLLRWQNNDDNPTGYVVNYRDHPVAKMKRAWTATVKAAGLGPDVTPHVLRHTCASWLLQSGKTVWEVAGILGASTAVIERVYGHHMPSDERKRA